MTDKQPLVTRPAYLDDSIRLFKRIEGKAGYRKWLQSAAVDLYDRLIEAGPSSRDEPFSEDITLLFSRRSRLPTLQALELLLHSLSHIASQPSATSSTGRVDRRRYLSVPLGAEDYSGPNAYSVNRTVMSQLIKALSLLGGNEPWLRVIKGRYNKAAGIGAVTRVEPRPPLLDYLVQYRLVFPGHPKGLKALGISSKPLLMLHVSAGDEQESEGDSKHVPLSRPLTASESILPKLNAALHYQRLSITLPNYAVYERHWDFTTSRSKIREQGRKSVYRLFTQEDGMAGRLYGHFVQSLPSEIRLYLRINQRPIVEVDYQSMQLALLYAEAGEQIPDGDPYDIDGMDRDTAKAVLTRSVGCASAAETVAAIQYHLEQNNTLRAGRAQRIYDGFWAKHHTVCPHGLGKPPAWQSLQNADSEIALGVLRLLLDDGIAAIPIHDSFIVQERHQEALVAAMKQAWTERYPDTQIGVKVSHAPDAM